ncbi:uncharacterized protein LY89DRAFT_666582 [Mollisia scopiformis]|uniref:Heterokaryon incompatibility domain-containing protein n=1 Tax=Mollisia scopiformis TaxID=149040 RepID=A0A194XHT8_MOLSC|nr:uncharacterized protein LY89DRAFT_666582 [Mollisia scopiformis]KUJ19723.1 hypothetical protein LY89DRAFT_666582 [Mollisia scopiformis]
MTLEAPITYDCKATRNFIVNYYYSLVASFLDESRVDIRSLVRICLFQCRDKQEALSGSGEEGHDYSLTEYEGSQVDHHDDIFAVERSSRDCELYNVIFQAFTRTTCQDLEVARGLQVVFRAYGGRIEVCYDTKAEERLIKLCGLDAYMDARDGGGRSFPQVVGIKEDGSPLILKKMEEDPSSKRSLEIASRWLKNCVEGHRSCRPPPEMHRPPKWLMRVDSETRNLFLIETSPEDQHLEWLALSYCWGGDHSRKLTKYTMVEFKNGIAWDDFDPTIRDAGGSTVTLVVASSNSVKNGFLQRRDLNYIHVPYSSSLMEDERQKLFLSPEWDDKEREYDGPWSQRGWTMQECLLPNRLLHYTTSQMIWKCCEEQIFERGVTESVEDKISEATGEDDDISFESSFLWQLPPFIRFKKLRAHLTTSLDYPLWSHSDTFRLWYDLIEDYTQRRFTNIDDRLVAITGLANIYCETIRRPTYVAGVWKEDLLRGLLWHVEGATLVPATILDAFPSWSWASVGYEVVKNDLKTKNSLCALSKIEEATSDRITITGPLRRLPRLYNDEWKSADASVSKLERHISEIIERESGGNVASKYCSPPGGHFSVLKMLDKNPLHLLVLEAMEKTPEAEGINKYHRAGVLKLDCTDLSCIASPEFIAQIEEIEATSFTKKLGLDKKTRTTPFTSNALYMEIMEQKWAEETVVIV